jgi:hypothetical protein
VFRAQGRENCQGKAAAAELLTEVFEAVVVMGIGVYARRHIVYVTHCISHSITGQEISCGGMLRPMATKFHVDSGNSGGAEALLFHIALST